MRRRSIRSRVTRRVLVLVGLAWGAAIALTIVFLDKEINEMLDEELQAVAETTVLYLDATPGKVIPRSIGVNPGNGERVLRILRLEDPIPDTPWPAIAKDGFTRVAGWRILRLTAENAVIEVAHSEDWRREEMLEAASALFMMTLPMAMLLLLGLRYSLRQGFAPLERLAGGIAARDPQDLTPVALDDLPRELRQLAQGLNGYVARIGDLRQAERQFVANASHELRTPLAAIRATLDLSADPQARAAMGQLDALTRRVERLLQLSRSEAGLGLGRGPADLVQILRLLAQEVGHAGRNPVRFDDGDFERRMVAADPDALAILLRNLLENAVEHGTGPVQLRLDATGVVIRNPVAAQAVFVEGAFAKGAGSRGTGLGLTIVAQLAAAMGAGLTKSMKDGMAEVRLDLPAA